MLPGQLLVERILPRVIKKRFHTDAVILQLFNLINSGLGQWRQRRKLKRRA
ncbi:MAG TPA: hypothetical protein VLG11_00570 [Candidatus Saccharimonadales bacterium]|nr:hypothetical protein [Candidatus Saccharimonadales bacterium]